MRLKISRFVIERNCKQRYDFVLQSGVTDMEEKVQYQSEERLRDIQVKKIFPFFSCYFLFQEQIASLETRISRMEHQAAQHQQVAKTCCRHTVDTFSSFFSM